MPKVRILCVLFLLIGLENQRIEPVCILIFLHDRDEPLLLQSQHLLYDPCESIEISLGFPANPPATSNFSDLCRNGHLHMRPDPSTFLVQPGFHLTR